MADASKVVPPRSAAEEARDLRLAGVAGLAFSFLSLVVLPFALPPPPALGATGAALAAWHRDHRTGFLAANYLGIAAFAPGLVQLAVLASRIRRREGPHGFAGDLVLASGTFAYGFFAFSLTVFQSLPFLLEPHQETSMEGMGTLANASFALAGLAGAPFVAAVGWATARVGVLPAAFVPASLVVTLLALVMSLGALTVEPAWLAGGGAATAAGFVAFFGFTGAIAVAFLREAGQAGSRSH